MFGMDDRAIDRFEQMFKNYSERQIRIMRGQQHTLRSMGFSDRRSVDRFFGFGVTPKNMQASEFQRNLTQMQERRSAYNDAMTRTKDFQARRVSRIFGMESMFERLGVFGDQRQRAVIGAASKLGSTVNMILGRRSDLVDTRFGRGIEGGRSFRIQKAIMQRAMNVRLGRTQEERDAFTRAFGATGSEQTGRFSPDDLSQIGAKLAAEGEFTDVAALAMGGKVGKPGKMTAVQISTVDKITAATVARRIQKSAVALDEIQKTFGVSTKKAKEVLASMKRGGMQSEMTTSDVNKLKTFVDKTGMSLDMAIRVNEMGAQLARQIGVGVDQGRGLMKGSIQQMARMQQYGIIDQRTAAAAGGMGVLQGQMTGVKVGLATGKHGRRFRGVRGLIELAGASAGEAGQALRSELTRQYERTGTVSSSLVRRAARLAGYEENEIGSAGTIDSFLEMTKGRREAVLGETDVTAEQLFSRIKSGLRSSTGRSNVSRVMEVSRKIKRSAQGKNLDLEVIRKMVSGVLAGGNLDNLKASLEEGSGVSRDQIIRKISSIKTSIKNPGRQKEAFQKWWRYHELDKEYSIEQFLPLLEDEATSFDELSMLVKSEETIEGLEAEYSSIGGILKWYTPGLGPSSERIARAKKVSARKMATGKLAETSLSRLSDKFKKDADKEGLELVELHRKKLSGHEFTISEERRYNKLVAMKGDPSDALSMLDLSEEDQEKLLSQGISAATKRYGVSFSKEERAAMKSALGLGIKAPPKLTGDPDPEGAGDPRKNINNFVNDLTGKEGRTLSDIYRMLE